MKKSAFFFAISAIICTVFFNCTVEPVGSNPTTNTLLPIVTTSSVTNIDATSSVSGGIITSDGGTAITARGIVWSINQNPTIADSKTINGTGIGSYSASMLSLTGNTTYYVRAYATNSIGTTYGNQVSFKTIISNSVPTLTTGVVGAITTTTASGGGNITTDGGSAITARGIVWSTTQNPTTANAKTTSGTGIGNFNASMSSLTENTIYYVRAYAINNNGTFYGDQVSFKTTSSTANATPVLTTSAVNSITTSSGSCGGSITSDGGAAITARGVVWSTTQNPTTANSKTSNGSGTGNFTSSITMLSASTTYYVRAYAINSNGTFYGNQVVFTTTAATSSSNSSFYAKLDGANFVPTILYALKNTSTNSISVVANRGGGAEAIGLTFPSNITPGTYNFEAFGNYVGQYTVVPSDPGFVATSGAITISSHDIATKRVIGTFNFTATSFTAPLSHQITQGAFDIKY